MKVVLLFFLLSLVSCATSYRPTITKSTEQNWSGGIAGSRGTNYYIEFESNEEIILDSLYFQDKCFKLDSNYRNSPNSYYVINESLYRILIKESSQERIPNFPNEKAKATDEKTCSIPSFQGKAMVTFYYDNRRDTVIINSFERLPTMAYP